MIIKNFKHYNKVEYNEIIFGDNLKWNNKEKTKELSTDEFVDHEASSVNEILLERIKKWYWLQWIKKKLML